MKAKEMKEILKDKNIEFESVNQRNGHIVVKVNGFSLRDFEKFVEIEKVLNDNFGECQVVERREKLPKVSFMEFHFVAEGF